MVLFRRVKARSSITVGCKRFNRVIMPLSIFLGTVTVEAFFITAIFSSGTTPSNNRAIFIIMNGIRHYNNSSFLKPAIFSCKVETRNCYGIRLKRQGNRINLLSTHFHLSPSNRNFYLKLISPFIITVWI